MNFPFLQKCVLVFDDYAVGFLSENSRRLPKEVESESGNTFLR